MTARIFSHSFSSTARLFLLSGLLRADESSYIITDKDADRELLLKFGPQILKREIRFIDSVEKLWNLEPRNTLSIVHPHILEIAGNIEYLRRMTSITLDRTSKLTIEELIERLLSFGYVHRDHIEDPGTYKREGSILTITHPHTREMVQIDYFDTEIDSIIISDSDMGSRKFVDSYIFPSVHPVSLPRTEGVINLELLTLFPGNRIIIGCDFLPYIDILIQNSAVHFTDFYRDHSISLSVEPVEIHHIDELQVFLRENISTANICIYTRYPKPISEFLSFHQFSGIEVIETPKVPLESCQIPVLSSELGSICNEKEMGPGVLDEGPPDKGGRGVSYISYNSLLTEKARELRKNMNTPEKTFWYDILQNGRLLGYKFTKQKPLLDYIVDFYCSELRLVIEIDGESHLDQADYDARRTSDLEHYGLTVLRFTNTDILSSTEGVYVTLTEWIRNTIGPTPQPPLSGGQAPKQEKRISKQKKIIIADDILSPIFVRERSKKSIAKHLDLLLQIKPGDFIVHRDHGIGRFDALVIKNLGNIRREYLEIHYAEGDKLFVPLTEIYRVSKYVGELEPTLTRLTGKEWERVMEKTDEELELIASELLEIGAKRTLAKGIRFGKFEEEKIFQNAFQYVYTHDQKEAILDVRTDMESELPMDRLLSGDVGFGKTEVAMNALYKAVLSGYQCAVISPLLVLADEHYETFTERLGAFGVRVACFTRMTNPREERAILEGLKKGTIDLVVGTHRLLSEDIRFAKLGLLVIDEEHKFGVSHKEKFKKFRANVDILSLSATPIPRSLNLALSGLRKISILTTPPAKKKPIETIVSRWNESTIAHAIDFELSRGGQVIILHNRIGSLDQVEKEIMQIVKGSQILKNKKEEKQPLGGQQPEQKANNGLKTRKLENLKTPTIISTHGRMSGDEIEDRIHAFKKREYDILLSTTIIENGVNFLTANTIIILDPEQFGLAQLHQLRGRVGRKDIQGYCYLIYRKPELATDEKERIITITNNAHLGAGFEIAMRDMEIRGAGDVLGLKQAGKSKEVGLSLYFRLLEEKIEDLKNERKMRSHIKIELDLSYTIPDDFFAGEMDKLSFFRDIESIESLEELEDMENSLVSSSENLGEQNTTKTENNISNLFLLLRARIILAEYGVDSLKRIGDYYVFDFIKGMKPEKMKAFLERFDTGRNMALLSIEKVRVETRYYKSARGLLESLV